MGDDPLSRLPHGPPFRFVDRVEEIDPGKRIVAYKGVTAGDPVLPGALLVEAMAQTAGLLLPEGSSAVLAQIGDARFLRPVRPGERVRIEAVSSGGLGAMRRFDVKASVDGEPVAEAGIVLAGF